MPKSPLPTLVSDLALLSNIKGLIAKAKESVISKANSELVLLNWNIGKLIKSRILMDERSEYGEKIVATVSQELFLEFGVGLTDRVCLE